MKLLPLFIGDVILPRVELVRPDVYLHRDSDGRANWTFENTRPSNAPADKPPKLPVIRNFLVQEGRLTVRDEIIKLKVEGTVQAHETIAQKEPFAFRIQGKGTINEQPFNMRVGGGPLINLDPDEPYPFKLRVRAGDIHVDADGAVKEPFDLGQLEFNVHTKGGDAADLYYLTQLALPNTPPFEISAHVERDAKLIKVTKLTGKVGRERYHRRADGGCVEEASFDYRQPAISTVAAGRSRDLVGREARHRGHIAGPGRGVERFCQRRLRSDVPADPNARLFPTSRLQVNRVRAMDADVRFHGAIH